MNEEKISLVSFEGDEDPIEFSTSQNKKRVPCNIMRASKTLDKVNELMRKHLGV
jgi:hypothetical protein